MKSGYKVLWTDHALDELEKGIEYLEINFSEKELKRLAQKIESTTELISQNPKLFPKSDKKGVYRVTILKFNTMYYRLENDTIEILSFFSNRQNPKKREI
ncbi:MAG TPA: type II toxin-antitoxin system RelE/ParE family toxin [Hanamia sp.]